MKTPLVALTVMSAVALTACDGERSVRITTSRSDGESRGVLKVVNALQCPDTEGSLTRKGSVSADGAVCRYGGPKGAEVILHLAPLNGATPEATLRAFEDQLGRDLPEAVRKVRAQSDATVTAMSSDGNGDTAHVRGPGMRIDARGDQASVRLPGLRVEADGDRASVRIGGFQIRADDHGASTQTAATTPASNGGGVTVNARDDATEVRTSVGGDATRMTYVLTDNQPSEGGWRMVGYEARGPAGGPLVVATVRAKSSNVDPVFRDAKRLVSLNAGD